MHTLIVTFLVDCLPKIIIVNRPPTAGTCSVSLADPSACLITETTGRDLAPVGLSATDKLASTTLLGATCKIYSEYVSSVAFMGCASLSCGNLIATVSTPDVGEAYWQVLVDGQYYDLILAEVSGFILAEVCGTLYFHVCRRNWGCNRRANGHRDGRRSRSSFIKLKK